MLEILMSPDLWMSPVDFGSFVLPFWQFIAWIVVISVATSFVVFLASFSLIALAYSDG
jgi:hypothetical protein